jgi:hypothetical protein
MNERLKQLAIESKLIAPEYNGFDHTRLSISQQRFAELIVQKCKENFAKVWYEQGVDCRGAELGKFMARFEEHFGVEE